jgi:hypothetical protein
MHVTLEDVMAKLLDMEREIAAVKAKLDDRGGRLIRRIGYD